MVLQKQQQKADPNSVFFYVKLFMTNDNTIIIEKSSEQGLNVMHYLYLPRAPFKIIAILRFSYTQSKINIFDPTEDPLILVNNSVLFA